MSTIYNFILNPNPNSPPPSPGPRTVGSFRPTVPEMPPTKHHNPEDIVFEEKFFFIAMRNNRARRILFVAMPPEK